ncbi:MAG TPA: hypothetical protein VNO43_14690, partial [Candidatus Eisenbacteria bacterium]|nr:hypothetical protein [Candidatus Eisenbacteria bacterium]
MPLARVVRSASRLAPVVLVLAWLLPARLVAEEIAVELDFFPREQSLRPLSEPVLFRITAIKGDGAPVPEGTVRVRLDAPRPPRFFSTDFPAVEGVRLLDMELPLRKGKTEWKYVFPIRGSYRLSVEATATGGGKANRVFQFRVREQERRLFFVTAGSLGLFLFGVVAGRILTTKGTRFPPGSVIVAITAGTLFAGEHAVRAREASGLVVDSAIVGQPARIHWSPGDAQQNRPVLLSLAVTHLEKQLVVFAVEKIPAAGE